MPKAASQPSNDPDFVKYTKYTKKASVLPDLPRDPPLDWRPLRINNPHVIGSPLLPEGVNKGLPINLFNLFFNINVLNQIAHYTNQHASALRYGPQLPSTRSWKPTSPSKLYTYFAIILFYAKGIGKGPVNLLKLPTNAATLAFTPTESVPVSLVLAVDAHGRRLFPPGLHSVWDDNLFNTIPMLEYLRQHGVGCAGTVRTTKTRTKEAYEETAVIELEAEDAAVRTRAR
ncbi:hypothetical protein BU23DRAFT_572172 [Bimuria novae-zelandiae CBS 107.79]|uniref:PiggyBac transposable element-derived protein domain-containing protein n=1 Tax=Bimuria novae-zelandiae CBS 107.79 TaxID=1447943 RepID=A0A6A5V5J1_9PLEO|nr:hypothetical protein BU23DRAFT_572172 [Bimuria novae-zelandiae CBS 107.79]